MPLYPEILPYRVHSLAVDPPHELHVEECGRPDGLPALFLHGGPGAGCEPWHRRFFDPARYRIVLFDQRGCGRSRPHAELTGNDTEALIADIEAIRMHLGIDRWVLFGGSWGSTLALAYAQRYPDRVLAMVLRGIFLCRDADIRWFYQEGTSRLFPDYWQDFLAPVAEAERGDLVAAYHRLLTGEDSVAQMRAARAWSQWEARTSTLVPQPALIDHFHAPFTALALARIECHYFVHGSFMRVNQLLQEAGRLNGIPGVIVHGRYDVVCPLEQAWLLHRAWPDSRLQVIPGAGHSAAEPATTEALVRATDEFADRLA